jgi:hypothetical protein
MKYALPILQLAFGLGLLNSCSIRPRVVAIVWRASFTTDVPAVANIGVFTAPGLCHVTKAAAATHP